MTSRRVGITGSAGFIGRHLGELLRQRGHGEVKFLIVANEVFDPDDPDTYVLPVAL